MSQTKTTPLAYYADFIAYPFIAAALLASALCIGTVLKYELVAAMIGALLWTLVEYILHRAFLHHLPYFSDLHDHHHRAPRDLIATPLWLSLLFTLTAVLFPASIILGFGCGAFFTAGMILGYLGYAIVHHGLHHWHVGRRSYLYRAKRRHALHHAFHDKGNFGVSTPLWDHVFGTSIPDPRNRRAR